MTTRRSLLLCAVLSTVTATSTPAQSPIRSFPRPVVPAVGAGFGSAIALLDDYDHDGLRDVAVAVPNGGGGWIEIRSGDTGAPLRVIVPGTQDTQEIELAALGDIDGDGFRDLLAGYPSYDTGDVDRGLIEVYSGRTGKRLRSLAGDSPTARLGATVAAVGDCDYDGVPDYTAAQPGWDGGFTPDLGFWHVWSGATGALIAQHYGSANGAHEGTSLAVLDDQDANGQPDIALGRPGQGVVRLFRSYAAWSTGQQQFGPGDPTIGFGEAMCSTPDLDGDGFRDLAIGAPFANGGRGRVYLYGSVSGTQLAFVEGLPGDHLGTEVAYAGDVDFDGHPDVVASGSGSGPTASMVFLDTNGPATFYGSAGGAQGFALAEDADGNGLADLWWGSGTLGTLQRRGDPRVAGAWEVGIADGMQWGRSVAVLGDLDGDGRAEVAVASPFARPTGLPAQGALRIFSQGQLLFERTGLLAEEFGAAVVGLDDLDGDGVDDFAVGRPNARFGAGTRCGAVSVYSGATATVLRQHFGVDFGDRFGAALARVPDTDGDGVDDYAVGSPEFTPAAGAVGAGRVALFSGVSGAYRFLLDGTHVRGAFGAALAGSGDLDGDGRGDLLVGAPGESPSLQTLGGGRVHRRSGLAGASIGITPGGAPGMRLGTSLATVGDFTGDGRPEFLVGALRPAVGGAANDGFVELRNGANGALLWSVAGAPASRLGAALVGTGDLDNDGFPDFAIGEPLALDPATNERRGRVRLYSGATRAWYASMDGAADGDRLGAALAGGADLDADGWNDLVVGAPEVEAGLAVALGTAEAWTARALGTTVAGVGTPGCAGAHRLTILRPAQVGQTMELRYSGMAANVLPILGAGDAVFPPGVPVLGMLLHVNPQIIMALPLASGAHEAHQLPLADEPAWIGTQLHLQVVPWWLPGCGAVPEGFSSSNALTITFF